MILKSKVGFQPFRVVVGVTIDTAYVCKVSSPTTYFIEH